MHQKKRKLFVLYSIPIVRRLFTSNNLCREKLHLVSYSIPLSCMVVLLLGGIVAVNPSLPLKSSAITIQDEWVVSEPENASISNVDGSSNDEVDDSFGGFGDGDYDVSSADMEAGIAPMSVVAAPTLAITVGNTDQTINAVQGGNTVYGSYNVGLTGSNVKDYTLSIKADSSNLTMPSGANSSTSIVSGAGSGTVGSSMSSNKWGYVITDASTSNYESLTYKTVPTTATSIASSTIASPYNLSASKKLVFAARFGDNVTPGQYSGKITLSLAATPAQTGQVWSNGTASYITDMQDIKSGFCATSIPAGSTITLKDNRGSSPISYKIIKMGDGTCWMAENLRLPGGTTLYSSDSDIANGSYTLPFSISNVSSWSSSGNVDNVTGFADQMINGSTSIPIDKNGATGSGTAWEPSYGSYYSWPAATANSGTKDMINIDAPNSICPNGWKLPAYEGPGSFTSLKNTYPGSSSTGWITLAGASGQKIGFDSDDAFFPAAGGMGNGGIGSPKVMGLYWSRRAGATTSSVSGMLLQRDILISKTSLNRASGYPVRCVATY